MSSFINEIEIRKKMIESEFNLMQSELFNINCC